MEYLAPPLKCILEVQFALESGQSVRSALILYTSKYNDEFARQVGAWIIAKDRGLPTDQLLESIHSPYRRALLEVFEQGWRGAPILKRLAEMRVEVQQVCDDYLHRHLAKLPILSLVPLLLLQFPGFMMLMLYPLVREFMAGFGS